jgi:tetratricopeptide (TPR) repeat protein
MRSAAQRVVRQAHALGVSVIAGSDGAYTPVGSGLVAELHALLQAGLSADEVLRAATSESATCLGLAHSIGRIVPRLQADLLVLDGDPRLDLSRLNEPKMVILGGRLVRRTPVASIIRSVLANEGIEAARARAQALHQSRVDSIRYGEYELIVLGYQLLEEKRIPEALAMFEVNVAAYPEAANSWDSLGDALLAAGRRDDAREAFGRAVSLARKHKDPRLPRFLAKLDNMTREQGERP